MIHRITPRATVGLLAFLVITAAAAGQELRPRPPVIKPDPTMLEAYHRTDVIKVKFRDDAPIRVRDGALTDLGTGSLDGAQDVLAMLDGAEWRPLVDLAEPKLEALRHNAQRNLGKAVADFRVWFHVFLPPGVEAAAAIDALNALDCVELAEGVQVAAPLPLPPPYGGLQRHLNAGPAGMGAVASWEHLGITGSSAVPVVDIEYGYDAHQDLPSISQIGPPGDPAAQSDRYHGTAVLGVIASQHNGWGTNGIAPDCGLGFAAAKVGGVVNIPQAIINATDQTGIAGAIILIELQIAGPVSCGADPCTPLSLPACDCSAGTSWVPVEWDLSTYNAILYAVGNGKTVIEPAGNGAQDLDAAVYSTGNGGHWPFLPQNDSGAIMVGAGRGVDYLDVIGSRICCSNYGSRVDVSGYGSAVRTTGYGDAYNGEGLSLYYTAIFAGTSSASACVAGVAALVQTAYWAANSGPGGQVWMAPGALRQVLINSGSPQPSALFYPFPNTQNIGPMPDASIAILLAVGGCIPLYDTTIGNPGISSGLNALASFDDGNGAKLYAGGSFTSAGGTSVPGVAAWNGSNWSAVGSGPGFAISDFAVYDDGNGAALYAAGGSGLPGQGGSGGIARWNGASWSSVGTTDGIVLALGVFNGDLYAGGAISNVSGTSVSNIAGYNGSSWSSPGGGVNGSVYALAAYNDGNGVALYAGGGFSSAGGNAAAYIASWNGTSWSALGSGLGGDVESLAVYHDGNALELYAGGSFHFGTGPYDHVAKWDGSQWSALGSASYNGTFSDVFGMTTFNDGTGNALFLAGLFEQAEDIWSPKVVKWDGTRFRPLGDGVGSNAFTLAVHDDGGGPALYIGGSFSAAYDLPSFGIVQYDGCPYTPCPGDIDGSGAVDVSDFLQLLAAWGPNPGHPADINNDGTVDVADFLALLAGWGNCP